MMRSTARVARKPRDCDDCQRRIATGETYLVHVASPNHDDLSNTRWWRISECSTCATRYGRGDQIEARSGTTAPEITPSE